MQDNFFKFSFFKLSIISICIILLFPTFSFAASIREGVGVTLGIVGGCIGLVLGWIIFPFTLSFIDVIGKSPINLFFSRLGGAASGAFIGYFLIFHLVAGNSPIDQPRVTADSTEIVSQSTLRKNSIEKSGNDDHSRKVSNERIKSTYVGYVRAMVNAINAGDFSRVSSFLLEDSPLWKSQIALIKHLVKKKIKEEVVEAYVLEIHWISDSEVELKTKEKIKIRYSSGNADVKTYYWKYKATSLNRQILFFDLQKWTK